MTKLRKIFTVSLMLVTVLSMSVVVAPDASAAASAGDLIKADGVSAVYYLGSDGLRYVFPTEQTYFSWYSDFSGVVTIPQSELEDYDLGGNLTARPGTKLVQEVSMETPWTVVSSKVYAVAANGSLIQIPDADTAVALFGADWEMRIIGVPSAYFTNYSNSGTTASEDTYPEGSLIQLPGSADIYYIDENGEARMIADEAAFAANRFNNDNVITTAADFVLPTAGDDITAAEEALTDTAQGGGSTPGITPGAGTGLSIALSSDTPSSQSVPSGATLVPFLMFNLTASNDGDVTVQNIQLMRTGTGATSDFSGGYLYEGDTRLSNKKSLNSSDHTITFTGLNYVVPAGTTKTVTLKMNAATGDRTGNHAFKIVEASDVDTNGATVSGSLPIQGNAMAFSAVDAATVTLTSSDSLPNVKVGETGVKVLEFDMANDSYEVVKVSRVRLKNNGSSGDGAITNLALDLDGTVVATGASVVSKYVEFVLDTPFEIEKGKTITATVTGDATTDVSKTFQLYLNNVADIDARGTAYGDFYSATITNTSLNTTNADNITINGSEINVSFDGPEAQDIKDDAKDVVFANFKIMSVSEDVNFDILRVALAMGTASTTANPDNIEMADSANNVIYTVADPTTSATSHNLDFENVYLKKGVQYNFAIRADIPTGVTAAETYAVSINFNDGTTNADYVDSDADVTMLTDVSSVTLTGKTMTVADPAVTYSKVTTTNSSVVENTDKVILYKGKITANAVSDLTVSKVKLDGTFGTIDSIDDAFEKLYLYTADDDLGTPLDTESSLTDLTEVTFSGFSLDIPKGLSNGVVIVVRGDVKNNPTAGTMALGWEAYAAAGYTTKDADNDALTSSQYTITQTDGQTTTIASQGTYTMTLDTSYTGLNANKNVLAGSLAMVGRLKMTAAKEEVKIEDFSLYNLQGTATVDDVAYLNLYSDENMTTLIGSASPSSKLTLFEDVNIDVPTTGVTYVYVGAVVKPIDYSNSPSADATATAARTVKLDIASTTGYTVKAVGQGTGETLATNGVASTTQTYTSTILGATMSNITTSFENALLANGTGKDIFSFKVTAPESSNVDYDGTALGIKMATTTFSVASSTGVTLASFKVERVGGTDGEKDAMYITSSTDTVMGSGTFVINFADTYGTNDDLLIRPGETAEYVVRATITGVGADDSLQTTIEGLTTNAQYTHNTGSAGTDGADISAVYPLLSGTTYVRGGSLTN